MCVLFSLLCLIFPTVEIKLDFICVHGLRWSRSSPKSLLKGALLRPAKPHPSERNTKFLGTTGSLLFLSVLCTVLLFASHHTTLKHTHTPLTLLMLTPHLILSLFCVYCLLFKLIIICLQSTSPSLTGV